MSPDSILRTFIRKTLNEVRLLKDFSAIGSDIYTVIELQGFRDENSYGSEGQFITIQGRGTYKSIEIALKELSKPEYNVRRISEQILFVNNVDKTIDLDVSKLLDYKSRRGGKSNSRSHTIPHADVSYDNILHFKKILKSLLKFDKKLESSYKIIGNPKYDGFTISDVLKEQDHNDIVQNKSFVFYHGTSEKQYEEIKIKGLLPGNGDSAYSDLIQGYSEYNIYLTTSVATAQNYATRAAVYKGGKAVVLKVKVNDPARLIPDEDSMNWLKVTNPDGGEEEIHFRHNHWKQWPTARTIMQRYMIRLYKDLGKNGTIAYKGRIPAKDITLFQTYKPVGMKRDPNDKEYWDAMEKTRASLKTGPETIKKPRKPRVKKQES